MLDGIILINKPVDFTSHDVVAKTRGILRTKKIGHSGTLDPMATGVLPLFIGSATKAIDKMTNQDKSYIAKFKLGIETDTQDITGDVIKTLPVNVSNAEVKRAVYSFKGTQLQRPPMYSAVWIDGRRLYDLARSGQVVEVPKREITVYSIELINSDTVNHEYTMDISCSKGTYVRTICHDIGAMLGCGATLTQLVRTKSSGFLLEDCITLDELQELRNNEKEATAVLEVENVFSNFYKVIIDDSLEKLFRNGVPLWVNQLDVPCDNRWLRIYNNKDEFVGIGLADSESKQLRQQKQF